TVFKGRGCVLPLLCLRCVLQGYTGGSHLYARASNPFPPKSFYRERASARRQWGSLSESPSKTEPGEQDGADSTLIIVLCIAGGVAVLAAAGLVVVLLKKKKA
ncbi:MAG: hypothetical protein IJZ37_00175, partial [Clostridia bacterium]|nr:hypothetical protein [Clostridia bacterium]